MTAMILLKKKLSAATTATNGLLWLYSGARVLGDGKSPLKLQYVGRGHGGAASGAMPTRAQSVYRNSVRPSVIRSLLDEG
jgi:hypothetical protein